MKMTEISMITILCYLIGEIVKVELGATFNAQDEFDWKYKK